MRKKSAVFGQFAGADADLAAEIAQRIGMTLPRECEAGVAFNARLIARHIDLMRGEAR